MAPEPLPAGAPDHDRLIRVETLIEEMHGALMGRGGLTGLVQKQVEDRAAIGQLRADMELFTRDAVDSVRAETADKRSTRWAQVASVAAFVTAVLSGALQALRT